MKLVSYTVNNGTRLGILTDDNLVVDAENWGHEIGIEIPNDIIEFIEKGAEFRKTIFKIYQKKGSEIDYKIANSLNDVILEAPVPRPRKNIFGIGLNYTEHVAESARTLDTENKLPEKCVIFSKPSTAILKNGGEIKHNSKVTQQMDWEGELAVIIGKKGWRVTKENAMDHVFGYTIMNDISARDNRRSGQWIVSKGMDTYAPMGPYILPKDAVKDPHDLQIITKVNGVEKQNGNTKYMLFNIPAIIADISAVMTLEPGDIIATGTPAGVGAGRTPQEWLLPGDTVEISITGLGTLTNKVVDDTY